MTELTLKDLQAALAPIQSDIAEVKDRLTKLETADIEIKNQLTKLEIAARSAPLGWKVVNAIHDNVRHIRAKIDEVELARANTSFQEASLFAEDLQRILDRLGAVEQDIKRLQKSP